MNTNIIYQIIVCYQNSPTCTCMAYSSTLYCMLSPIEFQKHQLPRRRGLDRAITHDGGTPLPGPSKQESIPYEKWWDVKTENYEMMRMINDMKLGGFEAPVKVKQMNAYLFSDITKNSRSIKTKSYPFLVTRWLSKCRPIRMHEMSGAVQGLFKRAYRNAWRNENRALRFGRPCLVKFSLKHIDMSICCIKH